MKKNYIILATLLTCVFLFGACKPKQSAYKSVYEAAKEKEMDEKTTETSKPNVAPVVEAVEHTKQPEAPVTVRKEKLTPATEADASGLKGYSVVVLEP